MISVGGLSVYLPYNKKLKDRAGNLRKNMTDEERKIWYCYLTKHPLRFLRQKIIDNYIADFYCSKAKLVIEIDGSQHFTEDGLEYDRIRTEVLEKHGLSVVRFTNLEIKNNFKSVCSAIEETLSRADADSSLK
jgi:very-short-patch-repair endonuclease